MRTPQERKNCKKLRIALTDIEKRLPALKKKAIDNQSKIEDIEKRLPELEQELTDAEAKCIALKAEIEKSMSELDCQLGPSWVRFWYKLQRKYRASKVDFIAMITILLTIVAFISVLLFHKQDAKLGLLTLVIGFSLAFCLLGIRYKKYIWLLWWVAVAFILFVISAYTADTEHKLVWLSVGLALIALGFAMHSFFSGESIEKRLDEINAKLPPPEKK